MKNINLRKPIDDAYRAEARKYLAEAAAMKLASVPKEELGNHNPEVLLRRCMPRVRTKLYHLALKRRMVEVTRLRLHRSGEEVYHRQTREPELFDLPEELLDIRKLVPDWKEIIAGPYGSIWHVGYNNSSLVL